MRRTIAAAVPAAIGALMLAIALDPAESAAGNGSKIEPRSSWDEMQKFEHYLGQLAAALNLCNSFGLSGEIRELADLSPYGRKGWASMQVYDGIRGGRCSTFRDDASRLLQERDSLIHYLTDKYE